LKFANSGVNNVYLFYFFRRIEVYIGRLNESTILAKNIAKNMKTPKLGMFFLL
jgi:hypothetical protein